MKRLSLAAACSVLILAGCVSQETAQPSAAAVTAPAGMFGLAMGTAGSLETAGNVPASIQRLMQLLGEPGLTPEERAAALERIAELSMGPGGYDLDGALGYYRELSAHLEAYPQAGDRMKAAAGEAEAKRRIAILEGILSSVDATNSEKFDALMNLGRHPEAIDLMVSFGIEPDNETLLAMYQTGYLCDEPGLTGQSYSVTDRDGSQRSLRFCDLGK